MLLKQFVLLATTSSQHNFYLFNLIISQLRIAFQFALMDSLITNSHFMHFKLPTLGVLIRVFLSLCVVLLLFASPARSNIRNSTRTRADDQWQLSSNLAYWNITGTYQGSWGLRNSKNSHSRSPKIGESSGDSVLKLISTPTKLYGVHNVKGKIIFYDLYANEPEVGGAQLKVEGVYKWPMRQLRVVASRGKAEKLGHEEDYIPSNPYRLLGVYTSQVFQVSPWGKIWKNHCRIRIDARISLFPPTQTNGDRYSYNIEGSTESFSVDHKYRDCMQPMLLSATSLQPMILSATFANSTGVYFIKAVNYNLMVTFTSFLEVLLLIRQWKHSNTRYVAARVSILAIGQQAIMDAYLFVLHLAAGNAVESLSAFATAAFFKLVVFSIFEMSYFYTIWKANRPTNVVESLQERRELAVLAICFCGIFLGGILIMYEFHKLLPFILLLLHSFWIPQIVTNVVRDSEKPLHPHYIIGMSITRLSIPLYIFGCPHNFMHTKPEKNWCICLVAFVGLQTLILLLQHYLGCRCFIPQYFRMKYNYHRRSDQERNHDARCVICLTDIDFFQPPNVLMVAPCDHLFHSECLQEWMDRKMACPTCRGQLPPVREWYQCL